jgi:hypothetical protein
MLPTVLGASGPPRTTVRTLRPSTVSHFDGDLSVVADLANPRAKGCGPEVDDRHVGHLGVRQHVHVERSGVLLAAACAVMWIVEMYSRTRRSMPSARSS